MFLRPRTSKPNSTHQGSASAFRALRHRDFRLLWLGQIISVTGSQMQSVAIHWHVYLLTESPIALGLVGLSKGVPIIICSLIGGVVADVADRRRLMIVTQSVMLVSAAVLTVITGLVVARLGALRDQGKIVIAAVAVFGLATVAFGLSRIFWFSLLMLAITGAADTVSTILRQTIRQLATPNHLRGRMTSINMVFFMGGPQLGELEAGLLAGLIGAPLSVVVGGAGSLAAAFVAFVKARTLVLYDDRWGDTGSISISQLGIREDVDTTEHYDASGPRHRPRDRCNRARSFYV